VPGNGKILLGKRKKSTSQWWGMPGGKVEFGENPIEAVKREVFEETNLKIDKLSLFDVVSWVGENGHKIVIIYAARSKTGELKNMEPDKFEEWRYFGVDELSETGNPSIGKYQNEEDFWWRFWK